MSPTARLTEMHLARITAIFISIGLTALVAIGCVGNDGGRRNNVPDAGTPSPVTFGSPSEIIATGWERSYRSGTWDSSGRLAAGSEILHLLGHKGKLYAAAGYWMDPRNVWYGGASAHTGWGQVLRLDRPDGGWEVDLEMQWHLRPEIIQSVTFTTNGKGDALAQPVSLLLASTYEGNGGRGITLFTRDDATGSWEKSKIISGDTGKRGEGNSVRAMRVYRDKVTGVDRLFVSIGVLGIFSGVYDSAAPGRIRWDGVSESGAVATRPLAIIEANGELFFSSDKFIYRRIDGATPRYAVAHDLGDLQQGSASSLAGGIRGLTAIANPKGAGQSLLFVWVPGNRSRGCVYRLDPAGDKRYARVEETCLDKLVSDYLSGNSVHYVLAAYNNMLPIRDPATQQEVHLIGLQAWIGGQQYPTTQRQRDGGFYSGAIYVVRDRNGKYRVREVNARINASNPPLVATRAYVVSPFASDFGKVVYFGGYDCNLVRSSDTAWIFRSTVAAALK
jgi:poly(A) polymerase